MKAIRRNPERPDTKAWWHALACGLLLLATGCGIADGGPIGTGIVASVSGNVVDTEGTLALPESAESQLAAALSTEGVRVSIEEVAEATTETDAEGSFLLEGDFAGDLTMRFETDTLVATASIEVPVGAALVLSDIELRGNDARPGAIQALHVLGRVEEVDCAAGEMRLLERARDRRLRVLFDENTAIVDARSDATQSCAELSIGATVLVGGTPVPGAPVLNADMIRTHPQTSARPPEREPVRFHGVVHQQRCNAGLLAVENRDQTLRIRILEDTIIEARGGRPAACEDLVPGSVIRGDGHIELRAPAFTFAARITRLGELGDGDLREDLRDRLAGTGAN